MDRLVGPVFTLGQPGSDLDRSFGHPTRSSVSGLRSLRSLFRAVRQFCLDLAPYNFILLTKIIFNMRPLPLLNINLMFLLRTLLLFPGQYGSVPASLLCLRSLRQDHVSPRALISSVFSVWDQFGYIFNRFALTEIYIFYSSHDTFRVRAWIGS